MLPWQENALKKRRQIFNQIPKDWALSQSALDDAHRQRQLTGSFIESLLDDRARHVTSLASQELIDRMADRSMTAVQVVEAFCRRSAIAHQTVKSISPLCDEIWTNGDIE